MDPDLRLRAKSLDPMLIGARLREGRLRAGLTQGEVAGEDASTAYISRMEAGSRRASPEILEVVAARLGVALEQLLAPAPVVPEGDAEAEARLRLELDYAELELRTGSIEQALAGASSVITSAEAGPGLRRQARHVRALALEAQGAYDEAIIELERLAADESDPLGWVRALLALARCYRDTGDLHRACDIGDRAFGRLGELGLASTDDAVRLTVTVASAHFERGDVNHAVRMCLQALDLAEGLGSDSARAAAYWNSSMMEAERGNVVAALPLAQKAIALLESTDDARNLARLRAQIGFMQLRLDPPEPDAAVANLTRSLRDLDWTSASPADVGRARLGMAQGVFLQGRIEEARALLDTCLDETGDSPLVRTAALVLSGRISLSEQCPEAAIDAFRLAAQVLTGAGSDRGAAQLWYELATLLEAHGAVDEALKAYRRAAASTGLAAPAAPDTVTAVAPLTTF